MPEATTAIVLSLDRPKYPVDNLRLIGGSLVQWIASETSRAPPASWMQSVALKAVR